jgi:hypothetical protein
MSWNGSWNEYQPHCCALGASLAYSWDVGAGWAFAAPQRSSFNPWVQGSSPWRPTNGAPPTKPKVNATSGTRAASQAATPMHRTGRPPTASNTSALITRSTGRSQTISSMTGPVSIIRAVWPGGRNWVRTSDPSLVRLVSALVCGRWPGRLLVGCRLRSGQMAYGCHGWSGPPWRSTRATRCPDLVRPHCDQPRADRVRPAVQPGPVGRHPHPAEGRG